MKDFYKMMTPDDEAEMNELVGKLLDVFLECDCTKISANTVMLHLIAHLTKEREAIELYSKELITLWNMYKRARDEMEMYD